MPVYKNIFIYIYPRISGILLRMDVVNWMLIVVSLTGLFVSILIFYNLKDVYVGRHPMDVAFMTFSLFCEISAFFPQIVENNKEVGVTNNIQPSFLGFACFAILLKIPGECSILREAIEYSQNRDDNNKKTRLSVNLVLAQTCGYFIPILFYIIWQFQVVVHNSDEGIYKRRKTACTIIGVIASMLVCFMGWLVYYTYKSSYAKLQYKNINSTRNTPNNTGDEVFLLGT